MFNVAITRRTALQSALTAGISAGLGAAAAPEARAAGGGSQHRVPAVVVQRLRDRANRLRPGRRSPNGWQIETDIDAGGAIWTRPVLGTGLSLGLNLFAAQVVLHHVVRRFHYEIDTLTVDEVIGFRVEKQTQPGFERNHASGTAIDIRPGWYPPGIRGGLFAREAAVVRDILAECQGIVWWGGDARNPCESHFQIDVKHTDPRLQRLVERLAEEEIAPGRGAGVLKLSN